MVVISFALLIISGAGVWFVRYELRELRRQTTIKRASMPILCVREMHGKKSLVYGLINKEDNSGDREFYIEINVENRGMGPLLLIGHIQHASDSLYDFRSKLHNNQLDISSISFDAIYTLNRGQSMFNGDSTKLTLLFRDINEYQDGYYYSIIFYKDILGNLYDTVARIHLRFEYFESKSQQEPLSVRNENYYEYNYEEQDALFNYLQYPSWISRSNSKVNLSCMPF